MWNLIITNLSESYLILNLHSNPNYNFIVIFFFIQLITTILISIILETMLLYFSYIKWYVIINKKITSLKEDDYYKNKIITYFTITFNSRIHNNNNW